PVVLDSVGNAYILLLPSWSHWRDARWGITALALGKRQDRGPVSRMVPGSRRLRFRRPSDVSSARASHLPSTRRPYSQTGRSSDTDAAALGALRSQARPYKSSHIQSSGPTLSGRNVD